MPNTKISALPSGTPAQNTDQFPIARSGANNSLQISDLGTIQTNAKFGVSGHSYISFDQDDATGFYIQDDTGGTIIEGDSGTLALVSAGVIGIDDVAGSVLDTDGSGNTVLTGPTTATLTAGTGLSIVSLVFTASSKTIALAGHIITAGGAGVSPTDFSGQVTITAATTSTVVGFGTNYVGTNPPVVVITPTSDPLAAGVPVGYWVTNNGSAGAWTGFIVHIQSALLSNVTFNYIVIGQQ